MPSIVKRKTSGVEPSPFHVYAGDDPKPGGYRAILKMVNMVKSSGDNLMFKPVLELKAKPGSDKTKFDGYPCFPQIVLTDNESNMQREQSFYLAVCGKKDADIVCEPDPGKFKAADGQKAKVLKIGGVKPENIVVNVKLRIKPAQGDYPAALECDLIFASRDEQDGAPSSDEEDEEADEAVDYTEDELLALGLPALRAILVDEFEMDAAEAKLLKQKAKLVEAILEAQSDSDEDDEDEDEESDSDEEDEDEDDEDDEEEDQEAEARATAGAMDRTQLKAAIKKRTPDFKFLKSQSDADLVEVLVPLILEDPPF